MGEIKVLLERGPICTNYGKMAVGSRRTDWFDVRWFSDFVVSKLRCAFSSVWGSQLPPHTHTVMTDQLPAHTKDVACVCILSYTCMCMYVHIPIFLISLSLVCNIMHMLSSKG